MPPLDLPPPPTNPQTLEPAPTPVLAISGLALAAMCTGISLRLTDALLPRLAAEFSVSLGQASQVVTAFAVAYGLSQLIFGPLGDRFGKYRVVCWACMASAVSSLLCALATDHASLLAARLLAGATAAAVIPLSMAWIGDAIPFEHRQPVLARFLIGQISGLAIGVWMGGYAAENLAWWTPFAMVGLVYLGVAIALQTVRKRLPADADRRNPATSGSPLSRMMSEFGAVLVKPWPRIVLLTVCLEGACIFGPFAFIATHLHLRFDMALSSAGAIVMMFALGGMIFAVFAKYLVWHLGEVTLVAAGSVLVALSMVALAFVPLWWMAMPASTLLGLGFYMMHNTLQTHATQMAVERRGAAVSSFSASFFLGQSVGVGLSGFMIDRIGSAWLLCVGAICTIGVAWSFNHRRVQVLPAAPRRGGFR